MRKPDATVPLHVVEKLLRYHLPILNDIRQALNSPLIISRHSGYRPEQWELDHGRNGSSQHTFSGLGAADLTCKQQRMPKLMHLLLDSDYPRVTWYEHHGFFHCDFKDATLGKRFYQADKNGIWKQIDGVRA